MPVYQLRPANADVEKESATFRSRRPLKIAAILVLSALSLGGLYFYREYRSTEALRASLLDAHHRLRRTRGAPVLSFERKVEALLRTSETPATAEGERGLLALERLREARGLYVRWQVGQGLESLAASPSQWQHTKDAFTRCLGISPASLPGFYEKSALFSSASTQAISQASGEMRLRVLEDEMTRRLRRDLPVLDYLMQSDYLMLVRERGKAGDPEAQDVYVWDLRSARLLAKQRLSLKGTLLTMKNEYAKGTPAKRPLENASLAGMQCAAARVFMQNHHPATESVARKSEPGE